MKKIKIIILLLFIGILGSCDQNETGNVSKITTFAKFNDYTKVASIPIGGTFSSDAMATENGENIALDTKSDIDNTTVGIYTYTSTAKNSDNFSLDATQTVIVYDPNATGTDVSGDIEDVNRPTRKGVISLVDGTNNIFYVTDFAFGGVFPMYFQMNGNMISEVPQNYIFSVTKVNLTYNPTTKIFTTEVLPYGFSYTFQYQ